MNLNPDFYLETHRQQIKVGTKDNFHYILTVISDIGIHPNFSLDGSGFERSENGSAILQKRLIIKE